MEFCPNCGKPIDIETKKCGCESKKILSFKEKIKKEKKGEGILREDKSKKGFPNKCKKCGCKYSDVIDLGSSYSDEANVSLYKCKKCGYVERDDY